MSDPATSSTSAIGTSVEDQEAVRHALEAWFHEVKKARWLQSSDIKRSYATASIVTANRVVFNIKGNAYRLVTSVAFEKGIVWIEWLGDHEAYDRIEVTKVIDGRSSQADQD